jgi:hypothetical protein
MRRLLTSTTRSQITSEPLQNKQVLTLRMGCGGCTGRFRENRQAVCLSAGDTIAHEVQKHIQCAPNMTDAMLAAVVNAMSEEQRVFVGQSWTSDGQRLFVATLEELVSISEEEMVFLHLHLVLGALNGDGEASDEEDDEQIGHDQDPGPESSEEGI